VRMGNRGFTLVELMVVLVIAGILFASAIVLIPGGGQSSLVRELTRFRTLAGIARERAMLEAAPYGIGVWSEGYGFYRLTANWQWRPVTDDKALKERLWTDTQWLDLFLEGLEVNLPSKEAPKNPQIHLFPDGNTTTFTLHLYEGAELKRVLHFNAMGEGEIVASED